jgi:hypothetical protein
MGRSTSWSVIGLASAFAAFLSVGACSDEDPESPGNPDGGGSSGRGGRGGSSGRGGSGGASGSGGTSSTDASTCTSSVGTACDGPEDCPSGQRCCGKWEQEYTEFGCYASCDALTGDAMPGPGGGGALWFDLCHPGDTCEVMGAECLTSPMYLPPSLSRCYDPGSGSAPNASLGRGAGQVNCGSDVCGAGEKCCLRGPMLDPYCAPSSATCSCTPPEPQPDAGPDAAPDSSPDAAPDSSDAAPDSSDAAPDSRPDATDATAG